MAIRNRLSILMGERRWNKQDVHERTGISRSSISTIYYDRSRRIDYETLDKLCEVFDCQPGDFLIRIKDENPSDS